VAKSSIKLLKEGGKLGIVIDNGVLSNTTEEAKVIRKLIQKYAIIEAIIGLPKGTFKPYGSNVIPCFMILRRKKNGEKQGGIFRAEATKVGLIPSRTKYVKDSDSDLQKIIEYWHNYKDKLSDFKEKYAVLDEKLPIWITNDNIEYRLDNNYFHPSAYKAEEYIEKLVNEGKVVKKNIREIKSEIIPGVSPSKGADEMDIPVIEGGNILPNCISPPFFKYAFEKEEYETSKVEKYDLIIVKDGSPGTVAVVTPKLLRYYTKLYASYHTYIIRLKEDYKKYCFYISAFLNSKLGQAIVRKYISGSVSPTIRDNDLLDIRVVIPTNDDILEKLRTDIESLQESVILSTKYISPSKHIDTIFNTPKMPRLPINWLPGGKNDKQGYFKEIY